MKNYLFGIVTAVALGVACAASLSQPNVSLLGESFTDAVKRPCIHPTGGWTEVDCSAAVAYSTVLDQWSRYIVQANGGDAYFAVTTAASGEDADSSDGYLPEGSWYEFIVEGAARYISCDGSATVSTVRYYQCQ